MTIWQIIRVNVSSRLSQFAIEKVLNYRLGFFTANVYVGLVASTILPVYFWLGTRQARTLKGVRRGIRKLREEKNNGTYNIIESIVSLW